MRVDNIRSEEPILVVGERQCLTNPVLFMLCCFIALDPVVKFVAGDTFLKVLSKGIVSFFS